MALKRLRKSLKKVIKFLGLSNSTNNRAVEESETVEEDLPFSFTCEIWDENLPNCTDYYQGFIILGESTDAYGSLSLYSLDLSWHEKQEDGTPSVDLGENYFSRFQVEIVPELFRRHLRHTLKEHSTKGFFAHSIPYLAIQMVIRTGWLEFTLCGTRRNVHLKFMRLKEVRLFMAKLCSLKTGRDLTYDVFDFFGRQKLATFMPDVSRPAFWAEFLTLREAMGKFKWNVWLNLECHQALIGPKVGKDDAEDGEYKVRLIVTLMQVALVRLAHYAAYDMGKKLPLLRKVMKDHSSPVSTLLHDAILAKEKYPTSYDNHLWEVDLESRKNGSIAIGRPDLVGMVHKGQSRAASEQKKSLSPLKRRAH